MLNKYGIMEDCFPFLLRDRRVDMILDAQDIRKFQIFDTCVWESELPNEPLTGNHPLGTIFWGMKEDEQGGGHLCAMHPVAKGNYAEQILDIVATEHNIPIEECLEYMPLLIHDISRYYQDQLILEPDYDSLAMSKFLNITRRIWRK